MKVLLYFCVTLKDAECYATLLCILYKKWFIFYPSLSLSHFLCWELGLVVREAAQRVIRKLNFNSNLSVTDQRLRHTSSHCFSISSFPYINCSVLVVILCSPTSLLLDLLFGLILGLSWITQARPSLQNSSCPSSIPGGCSFVCLRQWVLYHQNA